MHITIHAVIASKSQDLRGNLCCLFYIVDCHADFSNPLAMTSIPPPFAEGVRGWVNPKKSSLLDFGLAKSWKSIKTKKHCHTEVVRRKRSI
ncbi:hypothetical protein [Helicobacter sp. T3_23-1059]